jgi:hypothetical protein
MHANPVPKLEEEEVEEEEEDRDWIECKDRQFWV